MSEVRWCVCGKSFQSIVSRQPAVFSSFPTFCQLKTASPATNPRIANRQSPLLHFGSYFSLITMLRSAIGRRAGPAARRFYSAPSAGAPGENAFIRERRAVKEHAAQTTSESYLLPLSPESLARQSRIDPPPVGRWARN